LEAEVNRAPEAIPLILTLEMDPASQAYFEELRQKHYPSGLNQIPAHLTLFHKLPQESVGVVHRAAHRTPFALRTDGLRSLGRGVAFRIQSPELMELHAELSESFRSVLTAQDQQRFSPHVVVQNKATPEEARRLLAELEAGFESFEVQAVGLTLWKYLGGPWERAHFFNFR
jgi:2'-5' RNA ligase